MPDLTTSGGLRLHYRDSAGAEGGDGPPVLCLSGLTRNSADFAFVLPFLAGYRVIRMDYRGRGLSEAADPATYTVAQEAQDALELLDHLGLERVTILGTSRGGLIAMALAMAAPERLQGAILNDIGPELSPGGLGRIMDYVGRRPKYRSYDEAAEGLAALNAVQFPGVTLARWRVHAEHVWRAVPGERLALRYDAGLREALAQAGVQPAPDLWPFFDALAALPLTVLHGANSDLLSADIVARMQARAPGMRAVTVPDRGHVPFLDEGAALEGILSHLKDHI
ncbi:alpha/beta hydrolase [Pelagivirga sediminicola]|uniref:Alpha/beta hydrolase n=1 Tax=Pelagivirga sediminicola TaxID=2170575 RepID=A0A2T7G442_9RHOB|nr:alpha/beta hydrolase [Pelagivirga sediminicola]PVA09177.1 alpha/beta hydrolase [Pelagivirga sediminicola]